MLLLVPGLAAQDPPHNSTNGIQCDACHTIHNAPGAYYTTIQGAINLCQSCHNPLGVLPVSIHSSGGFGDNSCTDCHDPHTQEQEHTWGSTFSKLVRTTIATPNSGDRTLKLLAPTGPNSFADGDTVYDGVCEVCHTQTTHHRNNSSGDHLHNAGADCRQCHPHEDGFAPTGGECLACHNQSAHRSHPDPEVLLNDPDGGPAHTFDGSAASIEGFCRHCHDADGQGGNLTPFTNGQSPPDVERWWAASPAHANAPFGISCWNCHRNGHGSDDPSLTAALEENLCLSCHNGTLAQENILADFSKPYTATPSRPRAGCTRPARIPSPCRATWSARTATTPTLRTVPSRTSRRRCRALCGTWTGWTPTAPSWSMPQTATRSATSAMRTPTRAIPPCRACWWGPTSGPNSIRAESPSTPSRHRAGTPTCRASRAAGPRRA